MNETPPPTDARRIPEITLRHRLRIAREAAGMDQTQLADVVGVSRNTIGNAERGIGDPRRITLNAWAQATGVPVEWLVDGSTLTKEPA